MLGYKLFADPADLTSSSQVISYLFSGTTAITTTNVSGKDGLDVNIINPINVDLDGVYDGVTNTNPDNVGLIAHVRAATPADANQTFRFTGGAASSDNVVAANVHGLDVNSFGMVFDGTTWDRLLGTAGAAHSHIASFATGLVLPTKVCYTSAALQSAHTVTTSATQIASTPLTGRCKILIQNKTNKDVSIGFANTVTFANGIEIPKGGFYEEVLEEGVDVYIIGPSGVSGNAIVAEYAA